MRAPRKTLTLDFEFRSPLDLKKVGIYRVMKDPRTEILCVAANFDGHFGVYFDLNNIPDWLFDALADPSVVVHAYNATVERLGIQEICHKRHGWPYVDTKRFRCSAARAARLALPRALDKAGAALGLDVRKDKEGILVMRRLTRPLKYTDKGHIYDNDPEKLERLGLYCGKDVKAEMAVDDATFPMPDSEEHYYQLTERINDRGVKVDIELVKRLIWRASEYTEELNQRLREMTDSRVSGLTDIIGLKRWVKEETGRVLATLRKEDMDGLLQEAEGLGLPDYVKDALRIRQEGAKTSVSKLIAILNRVCDDGRVRGAFVFNGASTGRYTSMGVQLQNLVRAVLKNFDEDIKRLDEFTLEEISRTVRQCFIPEVGHVYVDADYNAIEARGVAWLAGAKKLLKIYQSGGDPYCEMGTAIYGRLITKADEAERFVGKQTILGCGYGMGWMKFLAQCEKFGQPVTEDMAQNAVTTYREEFPEIPELWKDIEWAAMRAVKKIGQVFSIPNGKISFLVKDGYLQMKLPNGRRLFYRSPKIIQEFKFDKWRDVLSFMAESQATRQWVRETTWGGKLTENAVQAMCRDLLFGAMDRLEFDWEIPIVLSVHDQIVCEVLEEDSEWAVKRVKKEMETLPPWAKGFPVAAEPKIALRFGK